MFLLKLTKLFVLELPPDKINEGDRHPFSDGGWPSPRPRPSLGTPAGSSPVAAGALAPGAGANIPQPAQASSHLTQPGCSQPSQLPPALWVRAGYLHHGSDNSLVLQFDTSQLGSYVCHPPKYLSIFPWRVAWWGVPSTALPLLLSSTDIVGMTCYLPSKSPWYAVFFVKASWWGGVLHQDNVRSKAALLPAGASAVVLNQPCPICKAACVTQKYLAVLHTSGFYVCTA